MRLPFAPTFVSWLAFAVASSAGCVVGPLELEGRRCPCATDWVCDTARDRCVRAGDELDAGADGGPRDAGLRDAGRVDAGPTDGGSFDAGPPDAGLPDAGPPDAGPPPPPTGCGAEHADRLFCDGFDADDGFAAWDRTDAADGSRLERVTDVVYRGTGALRAYGAMGSFHARVGASVFSTPPPSDQWLRAYYFVPASAPLDFEVHEMLAADDAYNAVAFIGGGYIDLHAHDWLGDMRASADRGFPRGRWVCLESHVHFDATAGTWTLYRDDVLQVELTGLDTTSATTGLPQISLGVVWKEASDPDRVIYVDEVVADTARIGCD